jgi:hypothetical protein
VCGGHERGRQEMVTDEAWEELEEAMKEGQIASIAQAHAFLAERGIIYADPSSVGQLLKRRQVKLKTGRPATTRLTQNSDGASKSSLRTSGEIGEKHPEKPLKILAFDEARFGLINWHKGFRPPHIVQRVYEWTYLYAAVDPTTSESFCVYMPHLDSRCIEKFWSTSARCMPLIGW